MPSWSRLLTGALVAAVALPACDHAEEPTLTLASAPLHLIIIEDTGAGLDGFAEVEALDPSIEVWSQAAVEMIIEDEPEDAFEDGVVAESLEDRTRRFLLALAGTVGAVELGAAATAPAPAERAPAALRKDVAPVSRASSRVDRSELAAGVAVSGTASETTRRLASLGGLQRAAAQPIKALEPHEIRQTIVRQLPRVRACYERTLKAEPSLSGRLLLSMSVKPSGEVQNARISDDGIGSETLAQCVENAVSSWSFPRGTETVRVDYPVTLKPSSGGW